MVWGHSSADDDGDVPYEKFKTKVKVRRRRWQRLPRELQDDARCVIPTEVAEFACRLRDELVPTEARGTPPLRQFFWQSSCRWRTEGPSGPVVTPRAFLLRGTAPNSAQQANHRARGNKRNQPENQLHQLRCHSQTCKRKEMTTEKKSLGFGSRWAWGALLPFLGFT